MIPVNLYPGVRLKLDAFGLATVTTFYMHAETKELVCNVKADGGELLHLSMMAASSRVA